MKKIHSLLLMMLIYSFSLYSQEQVFIYGSNSKKPPVRIVGDKDYAPIEWLENGEAKGIIPSLLPSLAEAMDRKIEYQLLDWKIAQDMVKNGDADVLTIFSPNREREKHYDFVDGILKFEMGLFAASDNVIIHDVQDLRGLKIGVTKGGFLRNFLEENSQAVLITIENHNKGFKQLLEGEIAAVATTKWVGAYNIQKAGLRGIKFIEPPIHVKDTHLGISKGNRQLKLELDKAINQLTQDGTIDNLTRNWESLEVVFITQENLNRIYLYSGLMLTLLIVIYIVLTNIILRKKVKSKTRSLKLSNQKLHETLTELHNTQDKLLQSQKVASLSALVSGISHEINTPLGIAVTLASNMYEENLRISKKTLNNEEYKNFINTQNDNFEILSDTLSKLVDLINNFKSITNHQFDVHKEKFKISEVISYILYRKESTLKHGNIKVSVDGDRDIELNSYPLAVSEIISHLISNSIIHGLKDIENPEIKIIYKLENTNLTLYVQDNGVGISEKDIGKVFDPFFTTKLGHGSSGLGLNIIYTVVTGLLGGEIKVENNNGCRYTITIPQNAPDSL